MEIKSRPMGPYQTNCYLVTIDSKTLIIDPGVDAAAWVEKEAENPVAILNTHGHFDHVWSNAELKKRLHIPIYCPAGDAFMLGNDPLGQGMPPSEADMAIHGDETVKIDGIDVRFLHFPGHTPGSSVIEISDVWFSGDFLFRDSIGRWDFPYSSSGDMVESLEKAIMMKEDRRLFPGHGPQSTLRREQRNLPLWIKEVRRSMNSC
jgi:glyoxylase-like metal-dependent hydrolase (beta-lactamase superfamily II)